jgi:flagellar biogenesis protein FliO
MVSLPVGPLFSLLARAWSWLQAKYSFPAAKRLIVSETVSLGEKRFVALVNIEGREFLIGGSGSGVSLLAQLNTKPKPASAKRRKTGGKEKSN